MKIVKSMKTVETGKSVKGIVQSVRVVTAVMALCLVLASVCAAASGAGDNAMGGAVVRSFDRESFVDHSLDVRIELINAIKGRKADPKQVKLVDEAADRTERLMLSFVKGEVEAREVVKSAADCLNKGYDVGGLAFSNVGLPTFLQALIVARYEVGSEELVRIGFDKLAAMKERAGREHRGDVVFSDKSAATLRAAFEGTRYEALAQAYGEAPRAM